MSRYAKHVSTRVTPVSQPIPGKPQVPNSGGGFSFKVDNWKAFERFLILGSEGGSYYASEQKLTIENAVNTQACIAEDPGRAVRMITEISEAGRAPKQGPAIFALAMAAGYSPDSQTFPAAPFAFHALPKVCRIGTDIFQFATCVQEFRGWGRGLRKAIGAWYTAKEPDQLAYQMIKYQQREGFSHRDLLRLAHPHAPSPAHDALFRWAVGGLDAVEGRSVKPKGDGEPTVYGSVSASLPGLVVAMEAAKKAPKEILAKLILENNLPRECVPTEHLNSPEIWDALLQKMPLRALVRNLGKMTEVGLLKPMSAAAKVVSDKLGDKEYILKSRLHPMAVLLALKTYANGRGVKGSLTWTPVATVNDALDSAFYMAFGNVEPANKRTLMGLDVSASMGSPMSGGILSCAEGAAAMAMIQMKTEPQYELMAFDQGMRKLDISKYSRLADVLRNTSNINGGGTNCSLPMTMALEKGWEVDTFQVYTDSETNHGYIHPCQALVQYRQKTGIPAKLVVIAMVANQFSIADPSDAGMLDCVGFDVTTPSVISDFSRS